MTEAAPLTQAPAVDPESGLVILYTSGTTGLPKGALISHRSQIARMAVLRMDLNVTQKDGFVAWAPMFHMASTDQSLGALMSGAAVHMVDGFEAETIVDLMERYPIGWMVLMPGSIEPIVEILEASGRGSEIDPGDRRHGRPGADRPDRQAVRAGQRSLPQQFSDRRKPGLHPPRPC